MKEPEGITFKANFERLTTTIDGGWNLTLSVSQKEAESVLAVSGKRDLVFQVAIVPIPKKKFQKFLEGSDEIEA